MSEASRSHGMDEVPLSSSPSTPLSLLTAVIIDTETTSIDTNEARIVQIGAVSMRRGRIEEKLAFDRLVNPRIAVPEASSRIHGLTTADLDQAPTFAELVADFETFVRGHLLIGYAIAFDLTVLKREYALIDRHWFEPRALDIRPLARALGMVMPDYSLDTIAAALGVEIEGRHTALGDARATAVIFTKLVPLLNNKGVRTLAEAIEFSRRSDTESVLGAAALAPERMLMARIDSFAYRHRVGEIMSSPPLIMPASLTLREILGIMTKYRVSSVFIEPGDQGSEAGIITERDILRMLDLQSEGGLKLKAGAVASRPLRTVAESDFIYRAVGRMNRLKIRHLAVTDRSGRIVGAVSARDLLRQRAGDAISMGDALDQASSIEDLADVWSRLPLTVQGLAAEKIDAREIAAVISHELCTATRRAVELAQAEILAENPKPRNLRYCVMVLGSGGRGESLLALDQDNALVFDPGSEEGAEDQWLEKLSHRFNEILDEVGVPLCKGAVMARNAHWRKSAAAWRAQLAAWLSRSHPEDILNADIFFDALPVYGDEELADDLRKDAIAAAAQSPGFLKLMAMNAVPMDKLLGWFGRLRTDEAGRVDLKRGGFMPIFSAARILALKHEVAARSTAARLLAVRSVPDMPTSLIDHLIDAHRLLLGLSLDQQLRDIERGLKLSNRVAVNELTAYERERLRWSLEQVRSIDNFLGNPLG
jgi:CBS domain-containing protein